MKLEFNRTGEDLTAFYKFDRWYSDERKGFRLKTKLAWGTITSIPFWIFISNLDKVTSVPGLVFFGLFSFSIGFFGAKRIYLGSLEGLATKILQDKANEEFVGPITMEFSEDKFTCATKLSQEESQLSSIKKIKEDANRYYLYNTSLTAYIIPKTVFRAPEEINQFEGLLKKADQ